MAKEVSAIPKRRFKYSEEDMLLAIEEVKRTKCSIRLASQKYNVPKTTLDNRVSGKYKTAGSAGVLGAHFENEIGDWLLHITNLGFTIVNRYTIDAVQLYLNESGQRTSFVANRPGRAWIIGFLDRHPEVKLKQKEQEVKYEAPVTTADLHNWFYNVHFSTDFLNCLQIIYLVFQFLIFR